MTTSSPRIDPIIFLVAPVAAGGPIPTSGATHRFAGVPHSDDASLAATITTGVWPEKHGVISRVQPHPDRYGFEIARPDRATGDLIWSEAVGSGRRVALCNWPHESIRGAEGEGDGRLDRIEPAALAGLSGEVGGVLPPDSVAPSAMGDLLRGSIGSEAPDAVSIGLEVLADRGPDLLMGWLPNSKAWTSDRLDWIEGLRRRLGDACGREATLLVLEHPPAGRSIYVQHLGGAKPQLMVTGPRRPRITGRPSVDSLRGMLGDLLAIEDASPRAEPDPPVGGKARLDAAGIPLPARIPPFDLKHFESTRSREIGASLMARGRSAEANAWLTAALQTQHGMIDAPVLGLLLKQLRRAGWAAAARDLFASVASRIPEPTSAALAAYLEEGPAEFDVGRHLPALARLGPFVQQSLLIDLRRRGRLGSAGEARAPRGLDGFDSSTPATD